MDDAGNKFAMSGLKLYEDYMAWHGRNGEKIEKEQLDRLKELDRKALYWNGTNAWCHAYILQEISKGRLDCSEAFKAARELSIKSIEAREKAEALWGEAEELESQSEQVIASMGKQAGTAQEHYEDLESLDSILPLFRPILKRRLEGYKKDASQRADYLEEILWLQQGINAANKGLKDAESEFVKIIKKALSV
jgi:hypothetical protein